MNSILRKAFNKNINNVNYRIIKPEDYYLFQVADLVCTLELLSLKISDLNKQENLFFKSGKKLQRNYINKIF